MANRFHIPEEAIEQYVLKRADTSDTDPIEEHLLICDSCRDRLEAAEMFTRGIREALSENTRPDLPAISRWNWLRRPAFAMAAGLAALVVVVAVVFSGGRTTVPVASLVLTAMRGEMPAVVAARRFDLTLSDVPREATQPFRLEVVTGAGKVLWSGTGQSESGGVHLQESVTQQSGIYFVRVYSAENSLLREYGFRVNR